MKFIFSQMAVFLAQQSNRRNMRFIFRFVLFVISLIFLYSTLFHVFMEWEHRHYSPVTGLYWTLTVMSTLGFGDITFESDIGKLFSVIVLMSGILLFMLILPFTFIRYVYAPWLDAQNSAMTPRELPEDTEGHLIIVGSDEGSLSLMRSCRDYDIPYTALIDDHSRAMTLFDQRYKIVLGDLDSAGTYQRMRADKAAMILALHDDMKNTNIASTVREVTSSTLLAATINKEESRDILHLAGCDYVFHFGRMLGESLARRVFNANIESNIIGRFDGVCVAESSAHNSPLVGKSLMEADLRGRFSLNVAGIWQGNQYMPARPDTIIDEGAVLLLAGTADKLEQYDRSITPVEEDRQGAPVLILGGGRVGTAVADTLARRKIPCRIVEQKACVAAEKDERYVIGNAADIKVLRQAGIEETGTVVVTTHNDDLNIYLTIYCRKLRPDIQIISRSTLDRNVASLYNAGANLVMSQAGLTANTVINLLRPGRVFMLTEGLNIFRLPVPQSLEGVTLLDSGIRNLTDCNVIAVRSGEETHVPPDPHVPLQLGDELILIGTVEAEKMFSKQFS